MVLVSDLMDRADLGVQAVLLPAPRAALTWVVATELLQPASYLEGGELVLTTGLVMADAEAGTWREYVASLVEAGVAALGLGTGIAFDTVPEDLREACRIGRLNLLEGDLEEIEPPDPAGLAQILGHGVEGDAGPQSESRDSRLDQ